MQERLGKGESNVFGRIVEVDRLWRAPQSSHWLDDASAG